MCRVNGGRLLALEGLDGCGKSTQLEPLAAALRAAGRDVVATREPSDGPHGRRIREMASSAEGVAPQEELRWFVEDRRQHVAEVIAPALAAGRVVVTDRYYLSSVAYQGARGIDWREILADSEREFPIPDLVLLFEIAPEVGLARVRARGGPLERAFERAEYLVQVAEIFRALDRPYIERVDASASADAVAESVRARVHERLALL
jgi:dTMP kinase